MPILHEKLFNQEWNEKARNQIRENLKTKNYDIVVIGAGITGAGVAREAAMRDLTVAIIDKQDFIDWAVEKLSQRFLPALGNGDVGQVVAFRPQQIPGISGMDLGTRIWACPGEIVAPGDPILDHLLVQQAGQRCGQWQVEMFGEDIMNDQVVEFTHDWA